MFNKLDVDSEPTEQDAKATKHWLGVLVAHTPMITLDQINSALAKAEGGQRCYADALVSWGKVRRCRWFLRERKRFLRGNSLFVHDAGGTSESGL